MSVEGFSLATPSFAPYAKGGSEKTLRHPEKHLTSPLAVATARNGETWYFYSPLNLPINASPKYARAASTHSGSCAILASVEFPRESVPL